MYIILVFTLSPIAMLPVGDAWSLYKHVSIFTRAQFNLSTAEQIESHMSFDRVDKNGELRQCPPELVIYLRSVWVGEDSGEA